MCKASFHSSPQQTDLRPVQGVDSKMIPTRQTPNLPLVVCFRATQARTDTETRAPHAHTHMRISQTDNDPPCSLVPAVPNVEDASTLTLPRHPPSASCCSSRWGLLARDAPLPLRPLLAPMSGTGGREKRRAVRSPLKLAQQCGNEIGGTQLGEEFQ